MAVAVPTAWRRAAAVTPPPAAPGPGVGPATRTTRTVSLFSARWPCQSWPADSALAWGSGSATGAIADGPSHAPFLLRAARGREYTPHSPMLAGEAALGPGPAAYSPRSSLGGVALPFPAKVSVLPRPRGSRTTPLLHRGRLTRLILSRGRGQRSHTHRDTDRRTGAVPGEGRVPGDRVPACCRSRASLFSARLRFLRCRGLEPTTRTRWQTTSSRRAGRTTITRARRRARAGRRARRERGIGAAGKRRTKRTKRWRRRGKAGSGGRRAVFPGWAVPLRQPSTWARRPPGLAGLLPRCAPAPACTPPPEATAAAP